MEHNPAGLALVYGSPPLVPVDSGDFYTPATWKARVVVETPVSRETNDAARQTAYALVYAHFVKRVEHRLGRYLTWNQDTAEIRSTEPATYHGDALDLFEAAWQDTLKFITDALRQWGVKV